MSVLSSKFLARILKSITHKVHWMWPYKVSSGVQEAVSIANISVMPGFYRRRRCCCLFCWAIRQRAASEPYVRFGGRKSMHMLVCAS